MMGREMGLFTWGNGFYFFFYDSTESAFDFPGFTLALYSHEFSTDEELLEFMESFMARHYGEENLLGLLEQYYIFGELTPTSGRTLETTFGTLHLPANFPEPPYRLSAHELYRLLSRTTFSARLHAYEVRTTHDSWDYFTLEPTNFSEFLGEIAYLYTRGELTREDLGFLTGPHGDELKELEDAKELTLEEFLARYSSFRDSELTALTPTRRTFRRL